MGDPNPTIWSTIVWFAFGIAGLILSLPIVFALWVASCCLDIKDWIVVGLMKLFSIPRR